MRRLASLVLAFVVTSCSGTVAGGTAAATTSPTTSPSVLAGGCGSTPVLQGQVPHWLDVAGGYNNPETLPYVIAHPPIAAGFLFVYPTHAGANAPVKVLWVVRNPRDGSPLRISGHPLSATTPTVQDMRPDNSGPGEIYPDGVNVPSPGCWQFDLRWGGNHTQVELNYAG